MVFMIAENSTLRDLESRCRVLLTAAAVAAYARMASAGLFLACPHYQDFQNYYIMLVVCACVCVLLLSLCVNVVTFLPLLINLREGETRTEFSAAEPYAV